MVTFRKYADGSDSLKSGFNVKINLAAGSQFPVWIARCPPRQLNYYYFRRSMRKLPSRCMFLFIFAGALIIVVDVGYYIHRIMLITRRCC